ncbi:ribosome small subunit-dependent GTPase A [Candidatus Cloacimonadota bacterium]
MDLKKLGWNENREEEFREFKQREFIPGRVAFETKNIYKVITEKGELKAELSGRMWYDIQEADSTKGDLPTVGDWVAVTHKENDEIALIHTTLKRFSKFSRKNKRAGGMKLTSFEGVSFLDGGTTEEQILAANIDNVFYVCSVASKVNLSVIERFLTMVWECGANPIIVCNKIDLNENYIDLLEQIESISMGVPVIGVSGLKDFNIAGFDKFLQEGKTSTFVGSSGVGKSTLINAIAGEKVQLVKEIRDSDGKGRHTTTAREMVILEKRGILIDTPGLREMQIWGEIDSLGKTFADIEILMTQCRFRNCNHDCEPGCAVTTALDDGTLKAEHYASYVKQKREIRFLMQKKDERIKRLNKKRTGKIRKKIERIEILQRNKEKKRQVQV